MPHPVRSYIIIMAVGTPKKSDLPQTSPLKKSPSKDTFEDFALDVEESKGYEEFIKDAVQRIRSEWPTIHTESPLPLPGTTDPGFLGLFGYGESPFDVARYNEAVSAPLSKQMDLRCAINIFNHNIFLSSLPNVPISKHRVKELAESIKPGYDVRVKLNATGKFATGHDWQRVSPDEPVHALLVKVAQRLNSSDIVDEEKLAWVRTLLSLPVVFERFANEDERFAEANSLRNSDVHWICGFDYSVLLKF